VAKSFSRLFCAAEDFPEATFQVDSAEMIGRPHLAEALTYRALYDRLQAAA
jgi:hypothetical protein